jgi:hypothetical protein
MPPESWLVVTVAAAFLLLGIAASPLAWVAVLHRRSRSEGQVERRFLELAGRLQALQHRLERCEAAPKGDRGSGKARSTWGPRDRPIRPSEGSGRGGGAASLAATGIDDPTLIAVPRLAPTATDRRAAMEALSQRYAAIWSLADTGASAEVIARATGQPIGQIELILGLRRRIDGVPTPVAHESHE